MKYLYLHGFASGPSSGKARFFAERFRALGEELLVPDLCGPDFRGLTLTRQLRVVEGVLGGEPAVLIGSSMGGYLAALYAAQHPEVEKLVLLAPAFGFAHRWPQKLGDEATQRWRETGEMEIFHYGLGRPECIGWQLLEDGLSYPQEPGFPQPALLFHGTGDDVVPASFSVQYAEGRPNVQLRLLPSDHQLTDQVELIWSETARFLFSQKR